MKCSIDFDVKGKRTVSDAKMVSLHVLVLRLGGLLLEVVLLRMYIILEFFNSASLS